MTLRLSTGLRTLLAGSTGLSAALANGVVEVYTGSQPANADAAVTGTLLGTITLSSGAFTPGVATNGLTWAAAAAGVASKTGVWSMSGIAAGTAGYFRFKGNAIDAGGVSTTAVRMDGSVGTSGADMNMSNIAVEAGTPHTVDVFQVTMPAA